jgi:hypothetical protein
LLAVQSTLNELFGGMYLRYIKNLKKQKTSSFGIGFGIGIGISSVSADTEMAEIWYRPKI